MSYLGDGDFNKRAGNLYVAFDAGAAPVAGTSMRLRSTVATMVFGAVYQAAFPAAVELGGTWGAIGLNGTLSSGNTVATFTGVSSVTSAVAAVRPVFWEIEILSVVGASDYCMGMFDSIDIFGNINQYFLASNFTSRYENTGRISTGFGLEAFAPLLVAGDIVGYVQDVINPSAFYFLNGVLVANVSSPASAGFTLQAMASRDV